MDEKAMLVANDNFNMISDERSRIKLNKQPDRTLSSFLLESQFYENLQIVRWVSIELLVIVQFKIENIAQHQFSHPSKKTTWSQIWDPIRPGEGLHSSQPPRILCLILSTSISEPLGNNISISVHDLTWLRNFNFHSIPRCSSMLEPNSLRSHEFESDDWINGNWQTARKSDTLLVRFQFPFNFDWIFHDVRNLMTWVSERVTPPTPRRTSPCSWTCIKMTGWRWREDAGPSGEDAIFSSWVSVQCQRFSLLFVFLHLC